MKNLENRQTRTQFEPTIAFEAKRHSFNALMRYWFHIPVNIQRKIDIWWCGPSRTCIDGITEIMLFWLFTNILLLPKTALKHEWASAATYNTSILLEIYRTSVNAVSYNFREYLEINIDAVHGIYLSRVCKPMNFSLKCLD